MLTRYVARAIVIDMSDTERNKNTELRQRVTGEIEFDDYIELKTHIKQTGERMADWVGVAVRERLRRLYVDVEELST